jgi:gluconate 2-dehydrogenase gamma chain
MEHLRQLVVRRVREMLPTMISRRQVLTSLLLAGTSLAFPLSAISREYGSGRGVPWEPMSGDVPHHGTRDAWFLTPDERATVAAICARLIPSDDDGPGASEADVVTFIDRQLAGFYGRAQHWYMQGPFPEGAATQGFQSPHPPAQLYRLALAELDAHCERQRGAAFGALPEEEQDQVLTQIESEEVTFSNVSAKTFFDLILENTIEGFFADPIYGGNRDMVGWHYVGFPGARYDYRDFLAHGGARIDLPPVGLMGRPGWSRP